jgi:hypothetical protein
MAIDLGSDAKGARWAIDEARFARLARVLADPRQLGLSKRIAAGDEVGRQSLPKGWPISEATMSLHVQELADARLVLIRREGKFADVRVIPEPVNLDLDERNRRLARRRSR